MNDVAYFEDAEWSSAVVSQSQADDTTTATRVSEPSAYSE